MKMIPAPEGTPTVALADTPDPRKGVQGCVRSYAAVKRPAGMPAYQVALLR